MGKACVDNITLTLMEIDTEFYNKEMLKNKKAKMHSLSHPELRVRKRFIGIPRGRGMNGQF